MRTRIKLFYGLPEQGFPLSLEDKVNAWLEEHGDEIEGTPEIKHRMSGSGYTTIMVVYELKQS